MVAANEEVHGRDVRRMITQEGAPSLRDSDLTLRARVIALFKLTHAFKRDFDRNHALISKVVFLSKLLRLRRSHMPTMLPMEIPFVPDPYSLIREFA